MALHRRSYNELVALLNSIIPPMMPSLRKGQLGRVGVVGGSDEYTGAPYFSAIAAANLGCDMVSSHPLRRSHPKCEISLVERGNVVVCRIHIRNLPLRISTVSCPGSLDIFVVANCRSAL